MGIVRFLPKPAAVGALVLSMLAPLAAAGHAQRPAGAHPSSVAPLGGVNVTSLRYGAVPADADRALAWARKLKVKVVRSEVPWAVLEPNGAGQIDPEAQAFTDRLVADAAADGIRVILTADDTPCWASSAPAPLLRSCSTRRGGAANAWPPMSPAAYATFVAYLAQRYGTRLAAIEIWNEPDHSNQRYWAGPKKPQRYAAMLRAAYTAIKRANPAVTVLGGSLVGSNGVFLRDLYAAGIKGYYDGLAVHYYNLTLGSVRAIHEVQLANGDSKPLWLDEFGWSSCYPQSKTQQEQACVTPAVQARNMLDVVRSLARVPYVAANIVYSLQGSQREDFGVLSSVDKPKPAFAALTRAFATPFASPTATTLKLSRAGGGIVARGAGSVGDYMELEAAVDGQLRYKALFVLNRANHYSIRLPRVLGTRGLTVLVYQLWAGATRGARRSI